MQRTRRRDSILKKSSGGDFSLPSKARRVSFSSKVNLKFFNKDEAIPPSSPEASPVATTKKSIFPDDKENRTPNFRSNTTARRRSCNSTEDLTMPLKGGSFQHSLDDTSLVVASSPVADRTHRFLDESMDLTQVATGTFTSSPRRHDSAASPPLSRTVILNESLDLTGVATDAFVLRPSSFSPSSPGEETGIGRQQRPPLLRTASDAPSMASPRRIARRRRSSIRGGPSRTSLAAPDENRTLVFDTTMDLTTPLPQDLEASLEQQIDALPPAHHPEVDDDYAKEALAGAMSNETMRIDETMDLTIGDCTAVSEGPENAHHVKDANDQSLPLQDNNNNSSSSSDLDDNHTIAFSTTMDLTAVLEETATDVARLSLASPLRDGPELLLLAKLRDAVLLTETERKQWGCDTLSELTKPTEMHAKELEEQIASASASSRSKQLSEDFSRAASRKSTLQAQAVVQHWYNDVEQSFNSALHQHAQLLNEEHDELVSLITQHKTSVAARTTTLQLNTVEQQDVYDILQGLTLWQLRSYTATEVSLLFKAQAPLRPHVLTLGLAPGASADEQASSHAMSAITGARLTPAETMGGQATDPFVIGLIKGINVQALLQQLTTMEQLRPVLEEVTFRLCRVQMLLHDLSCAERLSPHLLVERFATAHGACSVHLVFSLLHRGVRFSLRFTNLSFGFPYAGSLAWQLSSSFGPSDVVVAATRLVERHTTAPSHGLFTRLSQSLLAL